MIECSLAIRKGMSRSSRAAQWPPWLGGRAGPPVGESTRARAGLEMAVLIYGGGEEKGVP